MSYENKVIHERPWTSGSDCSKLSEQFTDALLIMADRISFLLITEHKQRQVT